MFRKVSVSFGCSGLDMRIPIATTPSARGLVNPAPFPSTAGAVFGTLNKRHV